MKKEYVIGVLGGMGTYATIHCFKQYADIFKAEKEWERPRIIIDNRCTMPSRVRAYLYGEQLDTLVTQMMDSMNRLKDAGCSRIILACNTSHLFLPKIFRLIPELEKYVVNIIYECSNQIEIDGVKKVFLLGSEGTINSGIYQDYLSAKGIECLFPGAEEFSILRDCIEAVKQNTYTEEVKQQFLKLVNRHSACILGCTELPILYERYIDEIHVDHVYDPLKISIQKLKEEFENE